MYTVHGANVCTHIVHAVYMYELVYACVHVQMCVKCMCSALYSGIYRSHPLPTLWFALNLTNPPLVYTCHVRIKLHGMPFGAEGRHLFFPTPYIPKPTPCCKFGGKSLIFAVYHYAYMYLMCVVLVGTQVPILPSQTHASMLLPVVIQRPPTM